MSFVLVTGGVKNIGKEISLSLAKGGFNVAIQYKTSQKEAQILQREIQAMGVKVEMIYGDFSTKHQVLNFVQEVKKKIPQIQGLINNVGVFQKGFLKDSSIEDLENIFQVNLFSSFSLIQAFLKDLIQHQGSIINIGICGLLTKMADNYASAYQMSKLSLLMLTKSLAKDLVKNNVRVNMVSPGYTQTSVDQPKDSFTLLEQRVATNKEIAEAVLFLLKHKYITGQNIEIAGGVRL